MLLWVMAHVKIYQDMFKKFASLYMMEIYVWLMMIWAYDMCNNHFLKLSS
jgi:hypothetical protein